VVLDKTVITTAVGIQHLTPDTLAKALCHLFQKGGKVVRAKAAEALFTGGDE